MRIDVYNITNKNKIPLSQKQWFH